MGSSGTPEIMTVESDIDVRPDQEYRGMERDFERIARNAEKYALRGANRFLDWNQWRTGVHDRLDANGNLLEARPMKEVVPHLDPPSAMDAVDYMVEMRRRSEEHRKILEQIDPAKDPAGFRKHAKDIVKYAGERSIGQAEARLRELYGGKLPPELEALAAEAKAIKSNPETLLKDPAATRDKIRRFLEIQHELLHRAIQERAAELGRGRLAESEILERRLRFALQTVYGGKDVEVLIRSQFSEAEWKEIEALRRFALEELAAKPDADLRELLRRRRERPTDPPRRIEPADTNHKLLERAETSGGKRRSGPQPVKEPPPSTEILRRHVEKKLGDTVKITRAGPGWEFLADVQRTTREIRREREPQLRDTLLAKAETRGIKISEKQVQKLVAQMLDFEKSEILAAMKEYWGLFSAKDQSVLLRGRSFFQRMLEFENGHQAMGRIMIAMMIWDIAWATYEGGWEGFLLASGRTGETLVDFALFEIFMGVVAPYALNAVGLPSLASVSISVVKFIPTVLVATLVSHLLHGGLEKAVKWIFWDPAYEKYMRRFYDFHSSAGDDWRGQGFFDPGREGHDLTPSPSSGAMRRDRALHPRGISCTRWPSIETISSRTASTT